MNKVTKLVLGAAFAGVLLAGIGTGRAVARGIGLYGEFLRVASPFEQSSGTPDVTLAAGGAYIQGTLEVDGAARFDGAVAIPGVITATGGILGVVPSTQTIAAGGTITANACGSLKRIDAATDVTTDTTATFATPAAANTGCCMDVVNVSATQTIYLDSNAAFPLTNVASAALGPNGSIRVCSDGTYWRHEHWTEY
jgi:hypothetical protein